MSFFSSKIQNFVILFIFCSKQISHVLIHCLRNNCDREIIYRLRLQKISMIMYSGGDPAGGFGVLTPTFWQWGFQM